MSTQFYDSQRLFCDNGDDSREHDSTKSPLTHTRSMFTDIKPCEHPLAQKTPSINQSQDSQKNITHSYFNEGINYSDVEHQSHNGVNSDYEDEESIYNECIVDDDYDDDIISESLEELYASVTDIPVPVGFSDDPPPPLPHVVYSKSKNCAGKSSGGIHHIESFVCPPSRHRMSPDLDKSKLTSKTSNIYNSNISGTFSKTKSLINNLRRKRIPLKHVFRAKTNSTDRNHTVISSSLSCDDTISYTSSDVSGCSISLQAPSSPSAIHHTPSLPLSIPPRFRGGNSSGDESTLTRPRDKGLKKKKTKKKPLLSKLKKNGFSRSLSDLRNFSNLSVRTRTSISSTGGYENEHGYDDYDFNYSQFIDGGHPSLTYDSHPFTDRITITNTDQTPRTGETLRGLHMDSSEKVEDSLQERGKVSQEWQRDYLQRILDNKYLFCGETSGEESVPDRKRKSISALTINARNLHKFTDKFNTSVVKLQTSLQKASIQDPLSRLAWKGWLHVHVDVWESERVLGGRMFRRMIGRISL